MKGQQRCVICAAALAMAHRKRYRRFKRRVFEHYGAVCACCGEDDPRFLSIDHVYGGGGKHRRAIRGQGSMYEWAVKNGFPDTLQLLCFNCNMGKQWNGGVCPHEEEAALTDWSYHAEREIEGLPPLFTGFVPNPEPLHSPEPPPALADVA